MLNILQMIEIQELRNNGMSIEAIAKKQNHGKNTVKKVLNREHTGVRKRSATPRGSKLDPYKDTLRELFEAHNLSGPRLHEHAKGMGYEGSYRTVRRFRSQLNLTKKASAKLTVRYETPPGKQAQCDWFEPPPHTWANGTTEKVYGFEIVLGHSRLAFTDYTLDMTLPTLLDCLARSFAFFGGVPKEILFDNMAQVRLPKSKELNPMMADFAKHYGFAVKTHRAYRPRTKGKVENFGGYAQRDFLLGRTFDSLAHLNAANMGWLTKANNRIHDTTRRQPKAHFEADEQATLLPLAPAYTGLAVKRKVNAESKVSFNGSTYSVPPRLCQQTVFVQANGGRIQVLVGDLVVADHAQATSKRQSVEDKAHIAERWKSSVGHLKGAPFEVEQEATKEDEQGFSSTSFSMQDVATTGQIAVAFEPDVQIHSLSAYEAFCDSASVMEAA